MVKLYQGGYFEQFIYQIDDYNWAKYDRLEEQRQSLQKQKQISEIPFRPTHLAKKLKYEDPFFYEE